MTRAPAPFSRVPIFARNMGLAAALALFAAVFAIGPNFLAPTLENDAMTVLRLAQRAPFVVGEGSYHYTALVAAAIPYPLQRVLIFAIGSAFLYRMFRDLRSVPAVTLALYLSIAPTFLFLTLFVKDSSIPILTLAVLAILQSNLNAMLKVALATIIYVAYGAGFREYYLLIALIFVALTFFAQASFAGRVLFLLAVVFLFALIPDHFYTQLQESRDILNRSRIWRDAPGARTAFTNYVPPASLASFVVNYLYAVLRLNFAPFFYLGIKELFLSFTIAIYAVLAFMGLRARDAKVQTPALLFVSHFLVLMLFEPDLGSYLRHASSGLLYLAPVLQLTDRRILTRLTGGRVSREAAPKWPLSNTAAAGDIR